MNHAEPSVPLPDPTPVATEIGVMHTCTEQLLLLAGDPAALRRVMAYLANRFPTPVKR